MNKGQDHKMKIELIHQLSFLDIIDFFKLQHTEMDIENFEDDNLMHEEKFFTVMAFAL